MRRATLVLGLLLVVVFLPFTIGGKTLLSSARDVQSILPQGARGDSPGPNVLKAPDAGAAAWQTEPEFAIAGHELLREHALPSWNPYSGLGAPLAGNLISQPYYPLSFLYSLAPSPYAYNWWVILRLLVAGAGMFAFLRFYLSFYPALLGGVATMLTGYYIFHYDIPFLSVDVMLPLLLFAVEYATRKPGPASFVVTFIAAFCTVAGGFPESTLLLFAFTAAYAAFVLLRARRAEQPLARETLTLIAGLGLGIAASAVVLLPFLEFWGLSFNVHDPSNGAVAVPGPRWDPLDARIGQYIAPLVIGPTRNNIFEGFAGYSSLRGYFGAVVCFLALLAIVDCAFRRAKREVAPTDAVLLFFVGASLVVVGKHYGFPLVNWIGYLPGFRFVIFPVFEEALLAVSVAACAAVGLERLLAGRVRAWSILASAGALLAAITALEATYGPRLAEASHPEYFEWAMTTAILALVLAAAAALACAGSLRARILGPAMVAVVALELSCNYILPVFYLANPEPALATNPYSGAPFVTYLQRVAPPERWRVFGKDGYLFPAWAGVFGLASVTHLDALYHRRYLEWVHAFLAKGTAADAAIYDRFNGVSDNDFTTARERRLLQLASAKYVVGNSLPNTVDAKGASSPFRRLDVADAPVYELSPVLSRATLYYGVDVRSSGASALSTIAAPSFDIFTRAVVEADPGTTGAALRALAAAAPAAAQPATIRQYGSSRVVIDARPSRPALLMLNDMNYPGWTASVDGIPASVLATDYVFRGVILTPGAHEVVFVYEPASVRIGSFVSLAAVIAAGAAIILFRRRRPASPASASDGREAG